MKKTFLLLLFSVIPLLALAQNAVTGKVVNVDGETLPGVQILEKGTSNGTITDLNGDFSITVSNEATLIFSSIEYVTQEIVVGSQTILDVVLVIDEKALDEVVVTALGIKREKKSLGYSVTEVDSEDMTVARETNAMNSLSGRVAGVQISQPTSGPTGSTRVLIRGMSELDGDNQPLYVIDGVPMDNTNFGQASGAGGYDMASGISDINPDDIETLSVLKGASASALYGSRALNGVVLITTKKGRKNKGIGVEVNSNYTFDQLITGYEDVQYEFGMGSNGQIPLTQARTSTWSTMWGARLGQGDEVMILDGTLKPYVANENNMQDFFRTGFSNTNGINISGSDGVSTFRFGASMLKSDDIVPGTNLERNTLTFRGTTKISDKLIADAKVTYITDEINNRPGLADGGIGASLMFLPNNYDQEWLKNHSDADGNYYRWTNYIGRENPYWVMDNVENKSEKKRIIAFAELKYLITDKLQFKVKAGTDFYSNKFYEIANKSTVLQNRPGRMLERNMDVSETNIEGLLSYNNTFGDFTISANLGGNQMQYVYKERRLVGSDIILDGVKALDNYNDVQISPFLSRKLIYSIYGFGQLGYKNYLYLDLTYRNDWSSTLPKDNRSYSYPSVTSSFVFSEAIEMPEFITFGKVRASWAQVGGDTDPFSLSFDYRAGLPFNGYSTSIVNNTIIPNKNLKPEKTSSYEFGTDIRFLGNRLGLDFTYYNQNTVDQILNLPVTQGTGFSMVAVNAGEVVNKGFEILLSTTPIKNDDFRWDLDFNFTKNVNEIVKLHDELDEFQIEQVQYAGEAYIYAKEGEPFGSILGKKLMRTTDGQIIHDEDGLPMVGTDNEVLGNYQPDWMGGISSSFSYKGLSFKMLFDIKMGGDIYSITNRTLVATGLHQQTLPGRDEYNTWFARQIAELGENASDDDVNAWIAAGNPLQGYVGSGVVNTGTEDNPVYETNTTAVNPSSYWGGAGYAGAAEPFVYDASYIKLRSLSISYTLPKQWVSKLALQKVTISAIANNLFTLYKDVPNIDPESTYNSGNGQGLEYGSFPRRRSYGFNINVKF